jgi:two-component system, LytTR family, response regulator
MGIRCIIVDDEINNIENLQNILAANFQEVSVVATATNSDEAIQKINEIQPDIVFLDIQMPGGKSGFDVLRTFSKINFEVIFITAYDKYGIQAIKFSALDYLLKPIVYEELEIAIDKAKIRISEKDNKLKIENLLEYIKRSQYESPKIALPTLNEITYVKTSEIIHCEAYDNYTTFFIQNREKILVCKPLKEYSEILKPFNFIRTHQSHLVNIQFVRSYLKEDGGKLLMKDLTKIPVSRQNRILVKEALNNSLRI